MTNTIRKSYVHRTTAERQAIKLFGLAWKAKAEIIEEDGKFVLQNLAREIKEPKKPGITKRIWDTAYAVVKAHPKSPETWRREVFAKCKDISVGTVASTFANWKKVNEAAYQIK